MKVNLKNLKGEVFALQIDPQAPISTIKQQVQAQKGISKESMKIIFKGKTLKDQQLLQKLGLKETDFLVVMNQVSKPAPKPKVEEKTEPKAPLAEEKQEAKPQQKKEGGTQPSSEPTEEQIGGLIAMGFPRDQCIAALQAAFGNADRAVDYLINGIPENNPPPGQQQPSNLMSSLQNLPQLDQLRTLVQNDPSSLPEVLAQINQTSPELYNMIMENPDEFEHILEGGEIDESYGEQDYMQGEQADEPAEGQIVISQQEEAAINRLAALGFSKIESAQAYMACDKNQELAASLLFDRLANGDIQQSFPGQSGDEDDDNLFN